MKHPQQAETPLSQESNSRPQRSLLCKALCSAGLLGAIAAIPSAYAVPMAGLTLNNQIVQFDTDAPGIFTSGPTAISIAAPVTGIVVVGIDYRPADGLLYGFTNTGDIVTIDPTGGATALVRSSAPNDFVLDNGFYGFDFNPVIDQIRLTSNISPSNQRIMLTPVPGTVFNDVDLTYDPADTVLPPPPATTSVEASAYTNSFAPSPRNMPATGPGTTLFGIDTAADRLVTHNPPTNSVLRTVGSTVVDFGPLTSFDIAGATTAFASSGPQDVTDPDVRPSTLYTINLTTGAATPVGVIGPAVGPTSQRVISIAAQIQPTPAFIQFTAATYSGTEGANAAITLTRGGDTTAAATATITATPGTAAAGDFTAPPATVTFAAGATTATVNIPIIDDGAAEGAETVNLALSAPVAPAILGTPNAAVLTIAASAAGGGGGTPPPPPPGTPPPADDDDDDGGCTVNPNGKDAGLLALLLSAAFVGLRRRWKK